MCSPKQKKKRKKNSRKLNPQIFNRINQIIKWSLNVQMVAEIKIVRSYFIPKTFLPLMVRWFDSSDS